MREAGNSSRLIVEIRGRSVVLDQATVAPLDTETTASWEEAGAGAPGTAARAPSRR